MAGRNIGNIVPRYLLLFVILRQGWTTSLSLFLVRNSLENTITENFPDYFGLKRERGLLAQEVFQKRAGASDRGAKMAKNAVLVHHFQNFLRKEPNTSFDGGLEASDRGL